MKLLSLRFGENFAPACGTILAHQELIEKYGFVWYGKLGNAVSDKILKEIFKEETPKLLLIKSGTPERYWAYIEKAQRQAPDFQYIPEYYRDMIPKIKCWFKITRIEKAPSDIMSKCLVISSGAQLSAMSRSSMNPCIFVDCEDASNP